MLKVAVALALWIAASPAIAACAGTDISMKQIKVDVRRGGLVRTVGELVSSCNEATSVLLTLVFRGKDGGVVGISKPWVVPQRIGPRDSLPFDDIGSTVERPEKVEPSVTIEP